MCSTRSINQYSTAENIIHDYACATFYEVRLILWTNPTIYRPDFHGNYDKVGLYLDLIDAEIPNPPLGDTMWLELMWWKSIGPLSPTFSVPTQIESELKLDWLHTSIKVLLFCFHSAFSHLSCLSCGLREPHTYCVLTYEYSSSNPWTLVWDRSCRSNPLSRSVRNHDIFNK